MSFGLDKALVWFMRKESLVLFIPVAAFMVGWELDKMEERRMTLFRDRSALFGRELGPNDKPSWP